jgi:hypothetical protein
MRTLKGLLLLARFRAEGFGLLAATPQGFMNSLAPLLALTVVGALGALLSGSLRLLLLVLFVNLAALLAPAVIAHALARLWDREPHWLRTIVAFNWLSTVMGPVLYLALLGTALAAATPSSGVTIAVLAGVAGYTIALQWFVFRRGLAISGGKAVLAVLANGFGTCVVVFGPPMLAAGMR